MKPLALLLGFFGLLAQAQDIAGSHAMEPAPSGETAGVLLGPSAPAAPVSPAAPFSPVQPLAPQGPGNPDAPLSPSQFFAVSGSQSASSANDAAAVSPVPTTNHAAALTLRITGSVQMISARMDELSRSLSASGTR